MIKEHKTASFGRSIGFSITSSKRGWIAENSDIFGKWLILDKCPRNLEKFKHKLDELAEKGKIIQAKFYNIKKMNQKKVSLLPRRKESILLVYCYKKEKEKVGRLLKNLGLEPKEWKSNAQTVKDWLPGGELFEEMKATLPKEKFLKVLKEKIVP